MYGETAAADGKAAFEGYLGGDFPLDQPGTGARVSTETSPFGVDLAVRYPHAGTGELVSAASAALPAWRDAGPQARVGVCLEILDRLHKHIFELANAVQFTSGQAFVMAFQAGGAHALDRALEALAYAYAEMTRHPGTAGWEKAAGKGDPLRMTKTFHVVPRGVALVIGCNTFPTWNSYPGLFASLVTGNPVIVKPHPRAVLPLAITVKYAREVLAEADFDPNLIMLAAEAPGEKLASDLALHQAVRIVDFTGSTEYGDWLETHARQASVYTEKAGLNTVVIDSTDDFAGMCRNLGFTLTLYSGQMCTTSQNILIRPGHRDRPGAQELRRGGRRDRRRGRQAHRGPGPGRGADRCHRQRRGAGAAGRGDQGRRAGVESRTVTHPSYADAVVRTPTIVKLAADDAETYGREWFGPISFAIATDSTAHSLELLRRTVGEKGALTAGVYSTDEAVLDETESVAVEVGCTCPATSPAASSSTSRRRSPTSTAAGPTRRPTRR
ncbi:aldehyde dehydrogenase family protein [Micromonospora sp. M12]